MSQKYPRIGSSRNHTKGLCQCCQKPAKHRVDIQVSYMRGDDEVYLVCQDHMAVAKYDIEHLRRDYEIEISKRRGAHGKA